MIANFRWSKQQGNWKKQNAGEQRNVALQKSERNRVSEKATNKLKPEDEEQLGMQNFNNRILQA